ncbi:MAG: hypothetical protein Q7S92_06160 [Candidatus Diapherotrites archaeon]|nr:hypothetical protein [Candidatus Diapherotrites archaeon]
MTSKIGLLALFLLSLLFFAFPVQAILQYTVQLDGLEARVELLMELDSQSGPVNYFESSMNLPPETEIVAISDSQGAISGYSINNDLLSFETNFSVPKEKEAVLIQMTWNNITDSNYYPFIVYKLPFSSFTDTNTLLQISGKKIISYALTSKANSKYSEQQIQIQGIGPQFASIVVEDSEAELNFIHYRAVNKTGNSISTDLFQKADTAYDLLPLILGVQPEYSQFPVAILTDIDYNRLVNSYSEAVQTHGGLILMRESTFTDSINGAATLLHETTHIFNSATFYWNNDNYTSWYDEGLAKIIESIAREKLGGTNGNLFYEVKQVQEGNLIYSYEPKGKLDELYNYYQNNFNFMTTWTPENDLTRDFGYAFAELFFKRHVKNQGWSKLQALHKKTAQTKVNATTVEELTQEELQDLGENLKPCYALDLEVIKNCLQEINQFALPLPEKSTVLTLGSNEIQLVGNTQVLDQIQKEKRAQIELQANEFKQETQTVMQQLLRDLKKSFKKIISFGE